MPGAMKTLLGRTSLSLLGRRNTARLGRFLYGVACLDGSNDSTTNGEFRIFESLLAVPAGPTPFRAFDVGANVGEWSIRLAATFKNAGRPIEVNAFEPFPATFDTLSKNLATAGATTVTAHPFGMSDAERTFDFYSLGANIGQNSLFPPEHGRAEKTTIRCRTIDDLCRERAWDHIDFLKIDTEGNDLNVIRGAERLIAAGGLKALQFEYNYRWIAARHYLKDAFDWLGSRGYRLGKVTPHGIEFYDGWHPELESFRECNVLAVPTAEVNRYPRIAWWNQDAVAGR
jgi:FkbM family methyltransferase